MFDPRFSISGTTATALMAIEADRQAIDALPLTVRMLDSLRTTARLISTHYSTQIEGNRLTASQVKRVLAGGGPFPGRERDEREVRLGKMPEPLGAPDPRFPRGRLFRDNQERGPALDDKIEAQAAKPVGRRNGGVIIHGSFNRGQSDGKS